MRSSFLLGLTVFVLVLSHTALSAQKDPVKWDFTVEQQEGQQYKINIEANLENGWYIYSQFLESDNGPEATAFTYDMNQIVSLDGKTLEVSNYKKEGHDDMFDMNIVKYSKNVIFTQKMLLKDATRSINGTIEYMTCNNEMCFPPKEVPFSVRL